eukprot:s194_g28.t1
MLWSLQPVDLSAPVPTPAKGTTCENLQPVAFRFFLVFWQVSGHWVWNDVWGKQSSILDLEVGTEFVKYSSRRNCIDLMGIRLLVSQVLQRCMMNMSNRQAVLVADSIFNRAGVVPGIYQAILAQGTDYRRKRALIPESQETCPHSALVVVAGI